MKNYKVGMTTETVAVSAKEDFTNKDIASALRFLEALKRRKAEVKDD